MKIAVLGAGSIGAFVGGALLAAGSGVVLVGRARMRERIAHHGLALSDLHGMRRTLPAADVPFAEDPAALAGAGLILVCVKSADTVEAGRAIAAHAHASAVVLSLQNGIGNADVLRAALPRHTVLGGMVPFNVAQLPDGRLHRGTEGELMVEASPALAPWRDAFARAGLPLGERSDFAAVQWGKLLLNLNNPVNALAGIPLRDQLSQREYRRAFAALVAEALAVLDRAGIRPARMTKVPPAALPFLLRLPDGVFTRLAAAMLRIDPEARSSMWEDLQAGRRTEVDYLNGAVVALAATHGASAPLNRRMVDLIRRAEQGSLGALDGTALLQAMTSPPPAPLQ